MTTHIIHIILKGGTKLTFKEIEKLLISNGWQYKNTRGSHNYYIHKKLPGKITIPKHRWRCKKRHIAFYFEASEN